MTEAGTTAAVGVAAGLAETRIGDTVKLAGMEFSAGFGVEAAALAGGAALQYFNPFMAPKVADGLFKSGLALMARSLTVHFATAMPAGGSRGPFRGLAQRVNPSLGAGRGYALAPVSGRAALGGLVSDKVTVG